MKKGLKYLAAAVAAVTALSCASAVVSADKIKVVDGVRYKYTDDGLTRLGRYSGWTTAKSGAKFYYKDGIMLKDSWLKVNGKRTYYFGHDGKMVTGEFINGTKIYYFGADGKIVYGIEAKGRKVSQTGLTLTLDGIALGSDTVDVWTGRAYYIEKKSLSGSWYGVTPISRVPYTDEGIPFFSDGRLIQRTEAVDWEYYYGKLDKGEYRLCKEYYVRTDPNSAAVKKTLYVPFNVNLYTNAGEAWGVHMSISDLTTDSFILNITQSTDNIGYVRYGTDYYIEQKDKNGKWTEINKAARQDVIFFRNIYEFRNEESAKNKDIEDITQSEKIFFYCGELPIGNYRIKRTFTGNCNGKKGSLSSYAEFDITTDTPNSWGTELTCENDANELGITLCAGVTGERTADITGDIWTGEDYEIERLTVSGDWEALEPVTDDGQLYWNDMGIVIPSRSMKKFTINWVNTYGKLPKGTYRISKTFYAHSGSSGSNSVKSRTMYCGFTIDAGGVNIGDYTTAATVTKATSAGLTLSVTRTGKYAGTVFWDHGYDLYKKNSRGSWKLYMSTSAINGRPEDTVDLPRNVTVRTAVDITEKYPELTAGTYRIRLKLTDQTGHLKYVSADFVIK